MLAGTAVSVLVLLSAVRAPRRTLLFEDPTEAGADQDDPSSWTLQGILDDGIDGDTAADPFKLEDVAAAREARTKARLGLKEAGSQRTTMLLGGDDWLGAPLAVPDDVRDEGEQRIGEDVTYWTTHSGQIGGATAALPPGAYARARRGQMPPAQAMASAHTLLTASAHRRRRQRS